MNLDYLTGFPGSSVVRNPPPVQVQFLGREDVLEKEMANHSSILAWEIPWTEEPDYSIQSMESQRVGHNLATINKNRKQQRLHLTFSECCKVCIFLLYTRAYLKNLTGGKGTSV